MIYKGKELKDISMTPQVIVPPRDMLVWDDIEGGKEKSSSSVSVATVLAIVDSNELNGQVIAERDSVFLRFGHCADIPTQYATFRQISRWLAEGNGEVTEGEGKDGVYCKTSQYYFSGKDNVSSEGSALRIRKWDDSDWHEPTLEYMGMEG